jgi:hypothetical protein
MVIAAVVGRGQLALRVDGAAEFSAPDNQCVVEHATLFQILTSPEQPWSTSLHWLGGTSGSKL